MTKLQEVFAQIFKRYPFIRSDEANDDRAAEPTKKEEDLTDEEKEDLETKGKVFAADLEQCIFELYAEPDKTGKPSVGGKYKYVFQSL